VREELERPRRELAAWTGRPCRFFAYCNGYHSSELVRAVRAAGYLAAFTTHDQPNRSGADSFRIGRKVLWEAHTRDREGHFSPALSAAYLDDLFTTLRLSAPIDGAVAEG
jgi:hypothetical protein